MLQPPACPLDSIYTPFWCEENVYDLVAKFTANEAIASLWHISTVFISNPSKTVALWGQKLAKRDPPDNVVVWDYHVVLVLTPRAPSTPASSINPDEVVQGWVYDFDTVLPIPCCTAGTFHAPNLHYGGLISHT